MYGISQPCNSTQERLLDLLARDEWWYELDIQHGALFAQHDLQESLEKNILTRALAVRMDYVLDPVEDVLEFEQIVWMCFIIYL